jgi:TRAP-type C4-dicarboxylate transport system permease large subunit
MWDGATRRISSTGLSAQVSTPPMGLILFVASSLTRLGIEVIAKELAPFLLVHPTIIKLVTVFPAIALFLPTVLGFHG